MTQDTIDYLEEKTIQLINTTYIDVQNEKKKQSDSHMSKIRSLRGKHEKVRKKLEITHLNKYEINVKQGEKKVRRYIRCSP